MKQAFFASILATIFVASCGEPKSNSTPEQKVQMDIDVEAEIDKWKKELVSSETLGAPCVGENPDTAWMKQNPNHHYAIPQGNTSFHRQHIDFDGDGNEEIFIHFSPLKCTPINGDISDHFKVITSTGDALSNSIDDVTAAIEGRIKETQKNATVGTFLPTIIKIKEHGEGILGSFTSWDEEDIHVSPSFRGNFTYSLLDGSVQISIDNK